MSDPKISSCSNQISRSVIEASQLVKESIRIATVPTDWPPETAAKRQLIARAQSHCPIRQTMLEQSDSERTNNQSMYNMPRLKKSRDNCEVGDGEPREEAWASANPIKTSAGKKTTSPSNPGTNHLPSFQKLKWEVSA